MGSKLYEIKKIEYEYLQEYFFKEPYSDYIYMVGISNLEVMKEYEGVDFKLKEGETLEDFCLSVYLLNELPEDLNLPTDYKGVRVLYKVIEEIELH